MHVVVVESPAKAKTINKYLGKDYQVLASFGHVRDLPAKDGSVKPDADFEMIYETDPESKKHLSAIAKALKGSETLYLATDPDREGEAISWHVLEALKASRHLPKKIEVKRITFDEITKKAVLQALENPRDIDMNLVNAQQARRALDYLVGFTLSPILWRKLPGSRSAGRVQSVALRLICERDDEIEHFVSREYWDISVLLGSSSGEALKSRLIEFEGEKLEKFSIPNEARATAIASALKSKQFMVADLEEKQVRRHPAPPFTTSTLQQEAARKLGYSAKKTMQLAQKLYEGVDVGGETAGLITYMRTDAVTVSQDALHATRAFIGKQFGQPYLPEAPRAYKTKAKNAQEAHEAIRPTEITRTPDSLGSVESDMRRLYELIWKRMVASQMESALYDQLVVDIASTDKKALLRATGSVVKFDGFLKLYQEGHDDDEEDEEERRLPQIKQDESLATREVTPEQHFTEPPPRYSEASLVKRLEELGIGRPSTYAAIISVLQDRGYVKLEKKRFVAEALGRIVNAFLISFFEKYVEYDFTADLEAQLDDISAGERQWKAVLKDFWKEFFAKIEDSKKLSITEVLAAVDALLEAYVFGLPGDNKNYRICPACSKGQLGLKLGRYGAYVGCSGYPDCTYRAQLLSVQAADDPEAAGLPKKLGPDPKTGLEVSLRKGPYGLYVQLGEGKEAKRISLLKGMTPDSVTLEIALQLLALPRELGTHPDTGQPIMAGVGRYGPYLQHNGKFTSLPSDDNVLTVGMNRAVTILSAPPKASASASTVLRSLGEHPDGGEVQVLKGRYGPYVKYGKINAPIPKGSTPESITLEEAVPLIAARAESAPARKARAAAKKTGAKKPKKAGGAQ